MPFQGNSVVRSTTRQNPIKRLAKPMLNFKSFRLAAGVLAGIELMHMIRKNKFAVDGVHTMFRSQADFMRCRTGPSCLRGTMPFRKNLDR